jgi:hypothetical protein
VGAGWRARLLRRADASTDESFICALTFQKFFYIFSSRYAMIRIQFPTDQDRIRGNYLLATHTVVRRLRGQVFEIAERDLRLLDDHQIPYTLLPIPEPSGSEEEGRNTLSVYL